METELMCDYSCFLFLLFSASLFRPSSSQFLIITHSLCTPVPFSCLLHFFHCPFIFCFFFLCIIWLLDLSLYVLHSFASFFHPHFSGLSYPYPISRLSLRLQWVWLRGECGVPPLSLAIKAMPTPRLRMSSRPSKRGGVLLIRSVSRNTNTPRQTSMCRCMFWLHTCCFVCPCLSVSLTKKCPSYQVYNWSWKHACKGVQVFQ